VIEREKAQRVRPTEPPPAPRDTATMSWWRVLFGGGVFDVSGDHPNQKGWELFELGQRCFWEVNAATDWDAPLVEDPRYAEPIGAMLAFLCPGEKAAVTGASYVSARMKSEEAQFYFAEQALEEAKHYDALRRLIPRITGKPLAPPPPSIRLLYSFGVIDPDDVAFMMGNINIIGEHMANHIFSRIRQVATSKQAQDVLALIARDESRHVAAGRRFFPEVYPEWKKNRRKIMAKNALTTVLLAVAGHDLVKPLKILQLDLGEVLEAMYSHYESVTQGFPAFIDQALLDAIFAVIRRGTPPVMRVIQDMTDEEGQVQLRRILEGMERAVTSPRALRRLFAA
jgi:rubrerythrin